MSADGSLKKHIDNMCPSAKNIVSESIPVKKFGRYAYFMEFDGFSYSKLQLSLWNPSKVGEIQQNTNSEMIHQKVIWTWV